MKLSYSIIAALFFCLAMTGVAPSAQAEEVEVRVQAIEAQLEGGAGVSGELKPLEAKLKKGFAAYTSFKQVSDSKFTLAPSDKKSIELPNKKSITISYLGLAGTFIKIGLSVASKMNTTLRATSGSTFFHAGLRHNGGLLILAITVTR